MTLRYKILGGVLVVVAVALLSLQVAWVPSRCRSLEQGHARGKVVVNVE